MSEDFAVDFYLRMKQAVTGRIGRDEKRRREASTRGGSKPFQKGRDPVTAAASLDKLLSQFRWDADLNRA